MFELSDISVYGNQKVIIPKKTNIQLSREKRAQKAREAERQGGATGRETR